jgi:ribonuclease P protein component
VLKSIRKRETIVKIFKEGKVFDSPLFKANYILSEDGDVRYALSVSRKLGIAVKRNRAKRVFKSALLHFFKTSILCVFRLKKVDFTYDEATKQLNIFQLNIKGKEFSNILDKTL